MGLFGAPLHPAHATAERSPDPPTGRARTLAYLAAGTGVLLFVLGSLSAWRPPVELYRTAWAGYDPPFEIVAGILLVVLSFRIPEHSPVAWLFSLVAPILLGTITILSPDVYSLLGAAATAGFVAVFYPHRTGFWRGSAVGPEATEFALTVAALVTMLFGTVGARWLGGQFKPTIRGWAQALYFTVTTISTNGSNFDPQTDAARVFVVVLVLLGVGTFLTAVAVLFLPFVERRLERIAARLERGRMQELERHVILCGASPEAQATARSLRDAGVRTVLLASDPHVVDLLKGEGIATHLGDPASEEELRYVGIERARALVVAQESDAANLLTVITARAMQPQLRIVAVAGSESSLAKLKRAGATESVSVVTVAAQLVSAAALDTSDPDKPHAHSIAH